MTSRAPIHLGPTDGSGEPVLLLHPFLMSQAVLPVMMEAGVGAIFLSSFRSRFALPSSLAPMKLDFGRLTSTLHLVCARASLTIPRVRAVAELLAAEMRTTGRRRR